jgi:hypothetical protein
VWIDPQLPTGGTITYTYDEHAFYLKAFEGPNVFDRTYVDIALASLRKRFLRDSVESDF